MTNVVIECSRLASNEARSNNNSNLASWNCSAGSGVKLNTGDEIRVSSAYLNEIGVGSDTIEFGNDNLTSELTLQYYKSGDAENLLQLPRNFLDDYQTNTFQELLAATDADNKYAWANRLIDVPSQDRLTATVKFDPNRDHEIYSDFYNQNYFNQRLTIMTSTLNNPIRATFIVADDTNFEQCYFQYTILEKTIILELPSGHLTPQNICSNINKQLSKTDGTVQGYNKVNQYGQFYGRTDAILPYSYNKDPTITKYQTYTPIQCATYGTFNASQGLHGTLTQNNISLGIDQVTDTETAYYWESFYSIAVYDPELFIAGRKLMVKEDNTIRIIKIGTGNNVDLQKIETDMEWTEQNCILWKNFIDAQYNNPLYKKKLNGNNTTRYIHVQSDTQQALNTDKLGCDFNFQDMSIFQEIIYYPESADIPFTPIYNPNGGASNYQVFGFLYHTPDDTIGFTLKNFLPSTKITYDYNTDISRGGCDIHFSAYGTNAFLLCNSLLPYTYYYTHDGTNDPSAYSQMSLSNNTETSSQINHIYVGASNPTLNFDSESSRFFWSDFHTSRKLRNSIIAEEDTGISDDGDKAPASASLINPIAGESIFTTYPRLDLTIYNPEYYMGAIRNGDLESYQTAFFTSYNTGLELGIVNPQQKISTNCLNVFKPNKIYDAQSGIFLKYNKLNEDNFKNSIWNKLGFTFLGMGLDLEFNRQTILSSNQLNSNPLMTNCEYDGSYIGDINSNTWGVALNVPWCYNVGQTALRKYGAGIIWNGHTPEINVKAISFKILASNKPIKQKFPYYTIRSNIILNKHYIGGDGGVSLPVVAVCNKAFVSDDYFYMLSSDLSFTVDAPYTISNITTSIHNPLGEFASINASSSVIYMIIKNIPVYRPIAQAPENYPQPKKINN